MGRQGELGETRTQIASDAGIPRWTTPGSFAPRLTRPWDLALERLGVAGLAKKRLRNQQRKQVRRFRAIVHSFAVGC